MTQAVPVKRAAIESKGSVGCKGEHGILLALDAACQKGGPLNVPSC